MKHIYQNGVNISNLPWNDKLQDEHNRNQVWFRLCDHLEATNNPWLKQWIIRKMKELFGYES